VRGERAAAPVGVLLVDDQRPFLRAARMLLESTRRFTVLGEATSGEQAVELALVLRPRLVVMDVRLPGLTGIQASRRIVEALPGTVVVLVSTLRRADLPPGLETCGAAAFTPKEDVDVDALAALMEAG
jgi:two-component system, NarL family, invasion response regulator UvrY